MSEWQPIETAPKDGTLVLTYDANTPYQDERILIAEYSGFAWQILIDGQVCHPTHWMPLPEPPE